MIGKRSNSQERTGKQVAGEQKARRLGGETQTAHLSKKQRTFILLHHSLFCNP